VSPEQIAAVIATAEKPKQAKIRSRLYGYCIEKGQQISVVESEAALIRQVFAALTEPSTLTATEIFAGLAETWKNDGIRNRSHQFFSAARLQALAGRSIYAGIEMGSSGWFRISNFPPIIPEAMYWAAKRRHYK